MRTIGFLREFFTRPGATGAVAASSEGLAELITDAARLETASFAIEFGPGTGVFTQKILQKLPAGARFFAMEINPDFVAATRQRCPGVAVHEASAVRAADYLHEVGLDRCDRIVCGLPWASFPETLQDDLLRTILQILEPGGRFVTFAYLQGLLLPAGQRFRRKLQREFSKVTQSRTVWMNVPPAFVYIAER